MELHKAYGVFEEIEQSIRKLEDRWGHLPEEYEFDYDDPEERYKHNVARKITDKLDDIQQLLKWINRPIVAEGRLKKNSNNRYEVQGVELSSGYPLDIYCDEEWIDSTIEHNGEDYYIVALGRNVNIDGMLVRIR